MSELDNDLSSCRDFALHISDRQFAISAYEFFRSRDFVHKDGSRFSMSSRYCADFIARMRNNGEDYVDFYLHDFIDGTNAAPDNPDTTATLVRIAETLGWRVMSVDDEIERYQIALRRLSELATQPSGTMPGWYRTEFQSNARTIRKNGHVINQLEELGRRGTLTENEFYSLRRDLILSDEAQEALDKKSNAS